jgi:indolepyruvate ferredoxin oxidoreductase
VGLFNADAVAGKLMGDTIYVNPMILGYAWQKGWIPLGRESLLRAIELNAVAVENNKTAFEWGRQAAHDRARVEALLSPGQVVEFKKRETVESLVARRMEFLTAYQDAAYAAQYQAFVEKVRATETRVFEGAPGKSTLTESVARYLFKLMAYKDEYEVARLHTDTAFLDRINGMFEGDFKLNYHMAPPLIAKKNAKGELIKQPFGPAMMTAFKLLTRLKGLRGGAFDIFRQDRGAQDRASADWRIPGQHRGSAEVTERGKPRHGGGNRAHSGADQGLWPCEGAPPQSGAPELECPDGGVPCPPRRASGRLNGAQRRTKTTFMIRMANAQRRMALVSY